MSGRQHHYLPQFLQRHFHSRRSKEQFYVHVHQKDRSYQPNVSGIGVERDFYGGLGDSVADENITRAEGFLGEVVSKVLQGRRSEISNRDFALLFTSLALRTKAGRGALRDFAPRMLRRMKEAVVESRLAEQAFDDLFGNPVKVRELVDGELKKHQIKGRNQRAAAGHALRMRLLQEAEAQRDKTIQSLEFQVQGLLSHLVTEAEGIADTAFLKILKNSSAPDPRIRYFEEYSYTVMTATESNKFILGDCGVVAIQSDGRPKLAFANVDKTVLLDEIWLPVSPDLAIVGRRTDRVHLLSSVDVNRCSAQLSLEFFISHNHDAEEIDEYRALIGTSDPFLTEEELCALSLGRAG